MHTLVTLPKKGLHETSCSQNAVADAFGLQLSLRDLVTLRTSNSCAASVVLTRLRCDKVPTPLRIAMPIIAAFSITVRIGTHLDDHPKRRDDTSTHAHAVHLADLRQRQLLAVDGPFDDLNILIPSTSVQCQRRMASVSEERIPAVPPLSRTAICVNDRTLHALCASLVPAAEEPRGANQCLIDHVALALLSHLAGSYPAFTSTPRPIRGGLAPWQEARAKAILGDDLAGGVLLARVADACGLSESQFTRAFRQTTGYPPSRWQLYQRVERAKDMLLNSDSSLAEIALASGFADQSHFSRVFAGIIGAAPGAWRRQHRTAPKECDLAPQFCAATFQDARHIQVMPPD